MSYETEFELECGIMATIEYELEYGDDSVGVCDTISVIGFYYIDKKGKKHNLDFLLENKDLDEYVQEAAHESGYDKF